MQVEVVDLQEGHNSFPDFSLTTIKQAHTAPSLGMRLNDAFAYVTDTVCTERTVKLARNVPLLAHECWLDEEDYQAALKRTTRGCCASTATSRRGGHRRPRECGHAGPHPPEPGVPRRATARMEQFGRTIFPDTIVLQDFQQFTLD